MNRATLVKWFLAAAALALLSSASPAGAESTLLFKSGFEEGVSLSGTYTISGQYWEDITGGDVPGFSWDDKTWNYDKRLFQYVLWNTDRPQDFVETKIVSTAGRDGNPTRALHMEFKKRNTEDNDLCRVDFATYGPRSESPTEFGYRYWVKLDGR